MDRRRTTQPWRRLAAPCALAALALLAPASAGARNLAPTGDLAERFQEDPATAGGWKVSRGWTWVEASHALKSSSAVGRASATWVARDHYAGELTVRFKLLRGRPGRQARARAVFARNPETGAYRYVQVTAGSPGTVVLGQAKRIGRRSGGTVRAVRVDVRPRAWHELAVVFDGKARVTVRLDGREVLTETVRPLAPGQVGFASVASRVVVDAVDFVARPDGEPCMQCHAGQADQPLAADVSRYWDGSWWDANMGGGNAQQQGGHGDPDGLFAMGCTGGAGCHDLRLPQPGDHRNGALEAGAFVTPNPKHLRAAFIEQSPTSAWDVQMTFDDACATLCHAGYGIADMRHYGVSSGRSYLQLGYGLTDALGGAIPADIPVDSDLTSSASPGPPIFATCVTCHDPHGSGVTDTTRGSNHMVRRGYTTSSELCALCHV